MTISRPTVRSAFASVVLLMGLPACATFGTRLPNDADPGGKVITAEMIERSGATDAWEALRRNSTHLTFRENARGQPTSLTYRGRSSIHLSAAPLVMLDGIRVSDFTILHNIPAPTIAVIRVLTGLEGTKYYGTGGGNGVIVIQTKQILDS